jgi:flavin-dependent dehydrogenase
MTDFDVVVVGAGLGGACAALALSQRGARVALMEAARFPRHKVCGEFLSPEIRRTFRRLNVEDKVLQGAPASVQVARVVASSAQSSTRSLEIALPQGALGLSRYQLDQILWDETERSGVQMFGATRVRSVEKTDGHFVVRNSGGEDVRAQFVLASPGRNVRLGDVRSAEIEYSNGAQVLHGAQELNAARNLSSVRDLNNVQSSNGTRDSSSSSRTARRYVGFKTHFAGVRGVANAVELYPFEGGYCGVGGIENGITNVCLLARYEAVNGRAPDEFWRWLMQGCPALKARLKDATPLMSWLATANVSFGLAQPTRADGVLLCGDAGGYIHPLTGDGMAMAARSGELAASIVAASLRGGLNREDVAPLYERAWRREFASRLHWASHLEPWLTNPRLARLAVQTFRRAPSLGRLAVAATRG